MKTDYFDDFPISKDLLPEKLARLLESVSLSPSKTDLSESANTDMCSIRTVSGAQWVFWTK